jgi:hypothetical protein
MGKRNITIDGMRQILLDYGICSEEYINGAICVGGMIPQTFERVLEYHTGYNSFELYLEDMEDEMED